MMSSIFSWNLGSDGAQHFPRIPSPIPCPVPSPNPTPGPRLPSSPQISHVTGHTPRQGGGGTSVTCTRLRAHSLHGSIFPTTTSHAPWWFWEKGPTPSWGLSHRGVQVTHTETKGSAVPGFTWPVCPCTFTAWGEPSPAKGVSRHGVTSPQTQVPNHPLQPDGIKILIIRVLFAPSLRCRPDTLSVPGSMLF